MAAPAAHVCVPVTSSPQIVWVGGPGKGRRWNGVAGPEPPPPPSRRCGPARAHALPHSRLLAPSHLPTRSPPLDSRRYVARLTVVHRRQIGQSPMGACPHPQELDAHSPATPVMNCSDNWRTSAGGCAAPSVQNGRGTAPSRSSWQAHVHTDAARQHVTLSWYLQKMERCWLSRTFVYWQTLGSRAMDLRRDAVCAWHALRCAARGARCFVPVACPVLLIPRGAPGPPTPNGMRCGASPAAIACAAPPQGGCATHSVAGPVPLTARGSCMALMFDDANVWPDQRRRCTCTHTLPAHRVCAGGSQACGACWFFRRSIFHVNYFACCPVAQCHECGGPADQGPCSRNAVHSHLRSGLWEISHPRAVPAFGEA